MTFQTKKLLGQLVVKKNKFTILNDLKKFVEQFVLYKILKLLRIKLNYKWFCFKSLLDIQNVQLFSTKVFINKYNTLQLNILKIMGL